MNKKMNLFLKEEEGGWTIRTHCRKRHPLKGKPAVCMTKPVTEWLPSCPGYRGAEPWVLDIFQYCLTKLQHTLLGLVLFLKIGSHYVAQAVLELLI